MGDIEFVRENPVLVAIIIICFAFSYWFKSYSIKKVETIYNKYFQDISSVNLSGAIVARNLLDANNLAHVVVEECRDVLTDHYDSHNKAVRLSTDNFHRPSLVGVTVAAHEVGHAIQDANNDVMFWVRSSVIKFIMISLRFKLNAILIGLGIILMLVALDNPSGVVARISATLIVAGFILPFLNVVFPMVTLAVEKDASNKAISQMKSLGMIADDEEKAKMKEILDAAALTYLSAVFYNVFGVDE